jgi:hypothetical protein
VKCGRKTFKEFLPVHHPVGSDLPEAAEAVEVEADFVLLRVEADLILLQAEVDQGPEAEEGEDKIINDLFSK